MCARPKSKPKFSFVCHFLATTFRSQWAGVTRVAGKLGDASGTCKSLKKSVKALVDIAEAKTVPADGKQMVAAAGAFMKHSSAANALAIEGKIGDVDIQELQAQGQAAINALRVKFESLLPELITFSLA